MGKRRASFPIFFSRSFARGYDSVTRQSIGMLLHSAGSTATDTPVSMTAVDTIRSVDTGSTYKRIAPVVYYVHEELWDYYDATKARSPAARAPKQLPAA
jgi:hypothetical protein